MANIIPHSNEIHTSMTNPVTGEEEITTTKIKPFQPYMSKTKMGLCKNTICTNQRREHSAYCQECSNKCKQLINNE